MKQNLLSIQILLMMALVPSYAENLSDQVADNSRSVNPYEGSFSYEASSPVDIQLPNFSLTADSGSLIHDLDIRMAFIPNKGGTPLPSNMENVTGICEGVSLLPRNDKNI